MGLRYAPGGSGVSNTRSWPEYSNQWKYAAGPVADAGAFDAAGAIGAAAALGAASAVGAAPAANSATGTAAAVKSAASAKIEQRRDAQTAM